jgi:molybdenum cofactor biosynthesis enzyme MoaA
MHAITAVFFRRHKANVYKDGQIDMVLFSRILCEAYDLGMREIGLFNNGEPFTARNLADYVKKAKGIGFEYVYLTTNGSLAFI